MTTFQRNAIIAGYINSYCLVCECFFETEEQIFTHIRGEEHKTKQLLYPYLEKYGSNRIRKVKAGYFCEHCSLLMATAVKVNLHIAEKQHYYNKGNSLLKQFGRSGSVFTAFDDVLISESAWHSFVEDACTLCDTEFDDGDEHKMERSHILKLLLNKVQFGENNYIYRKIDKNTFQCLTCNCVPAESTLEEHFNEDKHKQKYIQCQEDKKKFDLTNPKDTKVKAMTNTEPKEVEEKVTTDTNNVVCNNMETVAGKAVINQAEHTQTEIKASPLTPIKPTNKKIRKKESDDPATFAVDNNLVYDPRKPYAFCKVCVKQFPSNLRGMKEHIQGRDHINKITIKPAPKKKQNEKRPYHIMRSMNDFVSSLLTFNNTQDTDIVINHTICIPQKSCHTFMKIRSNSSEYKCQICDVIVSEDDLDDHTWTVKHEEGMRLAAMIFSLKNELIREIRPDNFHCAFCNTMITGWKATEKHLTSSEHKTSTASCNRRLLIHLPMIKAQQNDEKAKAAFLEFISHMRIN